MKTPSRLLVLLLTLSLLAPAALAEETMVFTDSAGRQVELPANIERFAPSGPISQMVLLSLAPERFVALSSEIREEDAQYFGEVPQAPVIGALYGTRGELNLEELLRLNPQVIIDVGEPKPSIKEDMDALQEQLGVPCVHISMGFGDAGGALVRLGALLGVRDKAEELAAWCDMTYARGQQLARDNEGRKRSVLYLLGDTGLNVIAEGSFHAEMLDLVADNAAVIENPTSKGTGNEVDMEQLYLWDPEYIIFAPDSVYDKVPNDPLWQGLKAVREGNYAQSPYGPYNWMGFPASLQRFLGLNWLQTLLYPQAADYDLKTEITDYYRLFYGHELSDSQYEALMDKAMGRPK